MKFYKKTLEIEDSASSPRATLHVKDISQFVDWRGADAGSIASMRTRFSGGMSRKKLESK